MGMTMDRLVGILGKGLGLLGLLAAGYGSEPCPEGYCSPEDLVVAHQLYGECSEASSVSN